MKKILFFSVLIFWFLSTDMLSAQTFPSSVPSGSQVIGSGSVNGQPVTAYQPSAQGPHLASGTGGNSSDSGSGRPPENDDDDNGLPPCSVDDEPIVFVYDVNVVGRDGRTVANNQLKTNVPYRLQTIIENDSCMATNDVLYSGGGASGAARVSYYEGNRVTYPSSANSFYRNDPPEGRSGAFPVSTIVDMAASGVPNITSRVNAVGPLGRDPDRARQRSYSRVVSPSQIADNRPVAVQKSRTQLASDEAGFTVSGNRATVYSAEFTLTTTGAGTIRAEADPNLGLSGGWILPRNSHARTENINVQTANLTLGSFLITDTGFGGANANSPRDYEYGNQIGIYWNGSNIDFAECTGRMTRTDGNPLNDFNGRRDTAGYSSSRLALLPSGTNQDRVDLNITEPAPNQAHAYTMTCPVIGGGSITRTLRIEMGGIPVSNLVTPGITNIYANPGQPIPTIDYTVTNPNAATVNSFSYELDVNSARYRSATVNNASLTRGRTITYEAANSSFTAPTTIGTYPMEIRVYLPGYARDNYALDRATLHVVPPTFNVITDNLTVESGAAIMPVTFTVRNTEPDYTIDGYRFEVRMNNQLYRSVPRWNVAIPPGGAVDDQASNNAFRAPSVTTTRTYPNYYTVCVYTTGVSTPRCDSANLTVTPPGSTFPLRPTTVSDDVIRGETITEVRYDVRNSSATAFSNGFRYSATVNGQAFGSGTYSGAVGVNGLEGLRVAGTFATNASTPDPLPIEVCLTATTGGQSYCDGAVIDVIDEDEVPECNDGVDNSDPEDILIDMNDPGCTDANDDDETNDSIIGDDDGTTNPNYILDFKVAPAIVRYNTIATLSYNITATENLSCTIDGSITGNTTITVNAGTPATGTRNTTNLTGTQTFRLTCTGPSGTDTATAQVEVVPETQEI